MRIGLFDSGVGGINVLKELVNKYPNNHYIFFGDTLNVPYGSKTIDELMILSQKIINFLNDNKVDLIIIACGTVSSTCYNKLKKISKVPIYDIITPIKKYINKSNYKNIGIIGTERTIESNVFSFNNKNIIAKATKEFVPIIEKNEISKKENVILNELEIFKDKIECLVLGCTHYPLLAKTIKKILNVDLLDAGKCLAHSISLDGNDELSIELYFSKIDVNLVNNIEKILDKDYQIYNLVL